jgi:hypothetical protein
VILLSLAYIIGEHEYMTPEKYFHTFQEHFENPTLKSTTCSLDVLITLNSDIYRSNVIAVNHHADGVAAMAQSVNTRSAKSPA